MKIFTYYIYSPHSGVALSEKAYRDHDEAFKALINALEEVTGLTYNGDEDAFFEAVWDQGMDGNISASNLDF
jgi:uncharacterized protein YggL (DUF469 family)